MTIELDDVVRRLLQPLEPLATGVTPTLRPLSGIRAVLFDVYGTLLISASGDIGSTEQVARDAAFTEACAAAAIPLAIDSPTGQQQLAAAIRAEHQQAQAEGVATPEVEIRDVWAKVLDALGCDPPPTRPTIERLAAEYEMRVNPIWPMPGARQTLEALHAAGCRLGIISNAQFYTPPALAALLHASLDELGFDPELRFYSYQYRRAKPGSELYQHAAAALARQGIAPDETLYVGNDVLKDVYPAEQVGFHTALFAGDARSLRLRADDPRVAQLQADLVITELPQIPPCIGITPEES